MNKTLWIIAGVIIVVAGVFYLWKGGAQPVLSSDLYPLYNEAEWSVPKSENLELSTTTVLGVGVESVAVLNTMDPGSVFSPFTRYYAEKLAALGWKVDNYLEAGGPMGGQTGYRKADKLIVLRFNVIYHTVTNTAPSQCPCDVTLSLFSTN